MASALSQSIMEMDAKDREFGTNFPQSLWMFFKRDPYFRDMILFLRYFNSSDPAQVAYTTIDKEIYLNCTKGGNTGPDTKKWMFYYMHECLHQIFETFAVGEQIRKEKGEYDHDLLNIASDCVINDYIKRHWKWPFDWPSDNIITPDYIEQTYSIEYDPKTDDQKSLYYKLLPKAQKLKADPKLRKQLDQQPPVIKKHIDGGGGNTNIKKIGTAQAWKDGHKKAVEESNRILADAYKKFHADGSDISTVVKALEDALKKIAKIRSDASKFKNESYFSLSSYILDAIFEATVKGGSYTTFEEGWESGINYMEEYIQSAIKVITGGGPGPGPGPQPPIDIDEPEVDDDEEEPFLPQIEDNQQKPQPPKPPQNNQGGKGGKNTKPIDDMDPNEAADEAQEAADRAQKAADEAKNKAKQSGNPDDKKAADEAQEAADRAQKAADEAKKAATKRDKKGAQDAANKAENEANKAENANNTSKQGRKGRKITVPDLDKWIEKNKRKNKPGNPGADIRFDDEDFIHEVDEFVDEMKKEVGENVTAEDVVRKFSQNLGGNLRDFFDKCKHAAGTGFTTFAPRGKDRGKWAKVFMTEATNIMRNKIQNLEKQYKRTYARPHRRGGVAKEGVPLKKGKIEIKQGLTITMRFYVDISGSMESESPNCCKAVWKVCDEIKAQNKNNTNIEDFNCLLYPWDTDIKLPIKYGSVTKGNGSTMPFDELFAKLKKQDDESEFTMLNVIMTDGASSTNVNRALRLFKDIPGSIIFITNSTDNAQLNPLRELEQRDPNFKLILADENWTIPF